MLEKAFSGSRQYWGVVLALLLLIGVGVITYLIQFFEGLTVTGLGRDIPWGFYISQFTFLVGVAASAVMVVLPYYLHNYKDFGKLAVLGELLAVAACTMCALFIFVDMGQPLRVLNIMLHPTPNSLMFWDMLVLMGYLALNVVITRVTFQAERKGVKPPKWIKPLIYLSVPWAVSIHTVTAFLYSGLEARSFWLTAVLAPRFLASAFASGPSLLILLCLALRRFTSFDPGSKAIQKLGQIVTYAMGANLFFVGVELFTALYSDMPEHTHHFQYLFFGHDGKNALVPWIWISQILALGAFATLIFPKARKQERVLGAAAAAIIVAIWIEKGLGMVITGFIPSPLGYYNEYAPTVPEVFITLGVYGIGFLLLVGLYKIVTAAREAY